MRSASLKHTIVIQSSIEIPDSFGGVSKSWNDFKTVRASVKPQSAKEFFSAGVQAEATHKIEVRYVLGLNPKMRILFGTRVFDIKSILNIQERNKVLHIICTEVL
ncbi:MAG: head-tail adaptor protein [Arcobacter sp.]|nr:MAG: head-tail adaptor protein [Arcobacter sp.]